MPMTLTGEVTLNACGCTLKTSHTSERRGREALHQAQRRIKAQLKVLDDHHVCGLVSEANPNGDYRKAPADAGYATTDADLVKILAPDLMQTHDPRD